MLRKKKRSKGPNRRRSRLKGLQRHNEDLGPDYEEVAEDEATLGPDFEVVSEDKFIFVKPPKKPTKDLVTGDPIHDADDL